MDLGVLTKLAFDGRLNADQQQIAAKCLAELETLLQKNTDYGSSALQRPRLAPHVCPADAILVRMSDKLNRLDQLALHGAHVKAESFDDTLRDLSGYVKLYEIARDQENHGQEEKVPCPPPSFQLDPEQGSPPFLQTQPGPITKEGIQEAVEALQEGCRQEEARLPQDVYEALTTQPKVRPLRRPLLSASETQAKAVAARGEVAHGQGGAGPPGAPPRPADCAPERVAEERF
jgi:hypothetical protein